jgi:hypothetical protein
MKSIIAFTVVCLASASCLGQCLDHHRGCGVCCPECKVEPNKKSCFCVDCEKICVPAIKFPWENCCVRKPGYVKVVRRISKKDYECCQKVVWEWPKPEKVPCCVSGHGQGCGHGGGHCGCSTCCDGGVSSGSAVMMDSAVPTPAPEPAAEPTPAAEPQPTPADVPSPPPVSMYQKMRDSLRFDF